MRQRLTARLLAVAALTASAATAQAAPWVQVYYTGWQQGQMPPALIDFGGMTQLIHFAVIPNNDGTLDQNTNGLTAANVQAAVAAAHGAGKQILFTVGGYPSQSQFESAMSAANEQNFINNIVGFLQTNHYDGVDLDMEPMSDSDQPAFVQFVTDLRTRLNTISPRPLLTTTALWTPQIFGAVYSQVDEINLMSYSLSGPYSGWFTWHNAPVYSTGYRFPSTGQPPPSADTMVAQFEAAGVPAAKLGIGFSMDPYIWTGVSYPGQTWTSPAPTASETAYNTIANTYGITEGVYTNKYYKWDANAQAPYLSVTDQTPNKFVSYDNEISAQMKANYINGKGLGGLIVWDLQDGYRSNLPAGQQQNLAEAVKAAFFGSGVATSGGTTQTGATGASGGTTGTSTGTSSGSSGSVAAIYNAGATSSSGGVTITNPTYCQPVNGGTVKLQATVPSGTASVVWQIDGTTLGTATSSPYSLTWYASSGYNGNHVLTATADNTSGTALGSSQTPVVLTGASSGPTSVVPWCTVPSGSSGSSSSGGSTAPPAATVSVTTPASGATLSGSVSVTATASNASSVQFQLDGANLGAALTASPYTMTWDTTQASNGSHTLAAVAVNSAGAKTLSAMVTVTVSNVSSSSGTSTSSGGTGSTAGTGGVSINNPGYCAAINGGVVPLQASVPSGTSSVQWLLDSTTLGTASASPFSINWYAENGYNGNHTIKAVALSGSSTLGSASVPVVLTGAASGPSTVTPTCTPTGGSSGSTSGGSGGSTPPPPPAAVVAITAPATGQTVSGILSVTASASNAASVQFKLDGANLGAALTAAPFTATWDTTKAANGAHILTAVAANSAGAATTSAAVTVTVNNPYPPTVSLTSPLNGATVSGSVSVAASASNATSVQFQLDGANLGSAIASSPFQTTWDTTKAANGAHILTAVATNAAGQTATSASATVNVSNAAPVTGSGGVTILSPTKCQKINGGVVTLSASVAVPAAKLQWWIDSSLLGTPTAPFSMQWYAKYGYNGNHTIKAVALGSSGNTLATASTPIVLTGAASGPAVVTPTCTP